MSEWRDKPTGPGWWFARRRDSSGVFPVEFIEFDLPGKLYAAGGHADGSYWAQYQFARCVAPPDWGLVPAITDACSGDIDDYGHEGIYLEDVLPILRAYLAGEPEP